MQLLETLSVAGDHGDLVSQAQRAYKLLLIARKLGGRRLQDIRGEHALLLLPGKDAGLDRISQSRNGHAEVHGVLRRPFAGALLLRFVEDQLYQRLPGIRVLLGEHGRGDFEQV